MYFLVKGTKFLEIILDLSVVCIISDSVTFISLIWIFSAVLKVLPIFITHYESSAFWVLNPITLMIETCLE